MTDFQLIRRSVRIEEVAKWLGIEVHGGKARCPFHNDQTPSLLFEEGLPAKACCGFGSGSTQSEMIVIPYGENSEYYTSRSISDKRFFKPRTEDIGPEPLFYEESLDQDEPALVVESALCALSIMHEGGHAVVVCGTGTRKLTEALRARGKIPPLVVCMDRDDAGEEEAKKLREQLEAMGVPHMRLTSPEGYKDPNELLVDDPELFRK